MTYSHCQNNINLYRVIKRELCVNLIISTNFEERGRAKLSWRKCPVPIHSAVGCEFESVRNGYNKQVFKCLFLYFMLFNKSNNYNVVHTVRRKNILQKRHLFLLCIQLNEFIGHLVKLYMYKSKKRTAQIRYVL
jgi:hypothetical protein